MLCAVDGYPNVGDKQTALALRLLCLTFVRTVELIGESGPSFVTWTARSTWEIPAERVKMKAAVPLSRQAVAILRELRAIGGDSRYLRPGRILDKPNSNDTLLFALVRECDERPERERRTLRSGHAEHAPAEGQSRRRRRGRRAASDGYSSSCIHQGPY